MNIVIPEKTQYFPGKKTYKGFRNMQEVLAYMYFSQIVKTKNSRLEISETIDSVSEGRKRGHRSIFETVEVLMHYFPDKKIDEYLFEIFQFFHNMTELINKMNSKGILFNGNSDYINSGAIIKCPDIDAFVIYRVSDMGVSNSSTNHITLFRFDSRGDLSGYKCSRFQVVFSELLSITNGNLTSSQIIGLCLRFKSKYSMGAWWYNRKAVSQKEILQERFKKDSDYRYRVRRRIVNKILGKRMMSLTDFKKLYLPYAYNEEQVKFCKNK